MGDKARVGRGIVYLPTSARPVPDLFMAGPARPAPPPRPNPALDDYVKSGATPRHKRGPSWWQRWWVRGWR